MMKRPITNQMSVRVEISHRMNPSRTISMSMAEFKSFIEEQGSNLGMIEKKVSSQEEQGFEIQLEAVEIPKELIDMIMSTKPKGEHNCPRCGNEEIEDDANFCIICGLAVKREEKVDNGKQ